MSEMGVTVKVGTDALVDALQDAADELDYEGLGTYAIAVQQAARELGALDRAMNPRRWSQAMSDAWHRALPDTVAAFEALRRAALSETAEGEGDEASRVR